MTRFKFLLLAILMLGVAGWVLLSGWHIFFQPPHIAQVHSIAYQSKFDYLRKAQWLNQSIVMLRHKHTSQRVILLQTDEKQADALHQLYQQTLNPLTFSLLLKLFQSQTKFRNETISLQNLRLQSEKQLKQGPYQLNYKVYYLQTLRNGKPFWFESDFGEVTYRQKTIGLLFTFNSKGYISLEPFQDMLRCAKSIAMDKAGST